MVDAFGTHFEIGTRYQILKPIGQGSYGVVCSAIDTLTGKKVAIKKIKKAFEHGIDTKRLLREIKLLRHLQHPNLIAIQDILRPASYEKYDDVYMVSEHMDTDLHKILRSPQPLTDRHIQYFLYQILRGLRYIHSAQVLHRDLKPSNLLLNENCQLKICDFGLARAIHEECEHHLTSYVVTRWYRAPELLLQDKDYTKAIDVWSVGCIMAELIGRKPLFQGKDYIDQIMCITNILGTPPEDDYKSIGSLQARNFMNTLKKTPKVPFEFLYPYANPLARDLLDKMLQFNPKKRITVDEALAHPYLSDLQELNEQDMPPCMFKFNYDEDNLSQSDLKDLIYAEMLQYHPEALQEELQTQMGIGGQERFQNFKNRFELILSQGRDHVF